MGAYFHVQLYANPNKKNYNTEILELLAQRAALEQLQDMHIAYVTFILCFPKLNAMYHYPNQKTYILKTIPSLIHTLKALVDLLVTTTGTQLTLSISCLQIQTCYQHSRNDTTD